jgi:hypothetical protein
LLGSGYIYRLGLNRHCRSGNANTQQNMEETVLIACHESLHLL